MLSFGVTMSNFVLSMQNHSYCKGNHLFYYFKVHKVNDIVGVTIPILALMFAEPMLLFGVTIFNFVYGMKSLWVTISVFVLRYAKPMSLLG